MLMPDFRARRPMFMPMTILLLLKLLQVVARILEFNWRPHDPFKETTRWPHSRSLHSVLRCPDCGTSCGRRGLGSDFAHARNGATICFVGTWAAGRDRCYLPILAEVEKIAPMRYRLRELVQYLERRLNRPPVIDRQDVLRAAGHGYDAIKFGAEDYVVVGLGQRYAPFQRPILPPGNIHEGVE